MKILVTGATGFIGNRLIRDLTRSGYQNINVLVRKSSKRVSLSQYPVHFIVGDIEDKESLFSIKKECDIVIHCAGYIGKDKKRLNAVNVEGTRNVCEFARRSKIQKFIYLSSISVVLGNKTVPLTENSPYSPVNHYGVSKVQAEKIVLSYIKEGLPAVIIRPSTVYGEEGPHYFEKVFSLSRKGLYPLVNKGKTKMRLLYVGGLTAYMIYCLENYKKVQGEMFFLADKDILTSSEIFLIISKILKSPRPMLISRGFSNFANRIPWLKDKIELFFYDRVCSIDKAESTGFICFYKTEDKIILSIKHWLERLS